MSFQKNHIVEKVEMLARQDRRKDKQNIARVRVLCFLCLFVKYLKGLKSPKSPYVSKVLKWRSLSTKGRYRAARAANKHRKIKLLSQYTVLAKKLYQWSVGRLSFAIEPI